MSGSLIILLLVGLLAVGAGSGIGFGIASVKYAHALEPYKATHALTQSLLNNLECITARMKLEVGQHSARVEQIDRNLAGTSDEPGDPERIRQAASELTAANEQLQAELAGTRIELDEQSQQLRKPQEGSRTDALTMLLNRRSFDESLHSLVAKIAAGSESGALLMIDIDHIKQVNDKHGQPIGDKLLKHVARTLREIVLGSDAVAARYGGGKFAVVLPAAPKTGEQRLAAAKALASRIRVAVEKGSLLHEGTPIGVRVSIGLVSATAGAACESIVARADEALYAAKTGGRNRCYYHTGKVCLPVEDTAGATPSASAPTQAATPVAQGAPHGNETTAAGKATTPAVSPSALSAAEGKSGRDRRKHDRGRCNGIHLVAPCTNDCIPAVDTFIRVQFFDISAGGFAMILSAPPTTDNFAIALKKTGGMVFMGARVMNIRQSRDVTAHGQPMTIVGCKFTQRLTQRSDSPQPEQLVSV